MSESLHPTKTRLALLQAVSDGAVTQRYPILPASPYAELDLGPGVEGVRFRKVTGRVDELYRAGWVRLGDRLDDHYKSPRMFVVTAAGEKVLNGGGLKPTAAQVELLRDIERGAVYQSDDNHDYAVGTHTHVKVTHKIAPLWKAGWIDFDTTTEVWGLLPAGRDILQEASNA